MQSERKINADINQACDGWIQVTLSGDGASDLTEAQIEAALSAAEPVPCEGCDGYNCDDGCAYPEPASKAAPPVAVKALDFDAVYVIPREMNDEEWAEVKYNVDRKANPDIELWRIKEAVKYANFIAGHRGRSALSAQVKDVAENGLTLSALQSAHVERQEEWCPDVKPDLSFRGNELGGECGEAQNVIKKLERERHGWRGSRDTVEHLAEELADVIHCSVLVAITAGVDLQQAVIAKFNDTSMKNGLSVMLPAAPAKQEGGHD